MQFYISNAINIFPEAVLFFLIQHKVELILSEM